MVSLVFSFLSLRLDLHCAGKRSFEVYMPARRQKWNESWERIRVAFVLSIVNHPGCFSVLTFPDHFLTRFCQPPIHQGHVAYFQFSHMWSCIPRHISNSLCACPGFSRNLCLFFPVRIGYMMLRILLSPSCVTSDKLLSISELMSLSVGWSLSHLSQKGITNEMTQLILHIGKFCICEPSQPQIKNI